MKTIEKIFNVAEYNLARLDAQMDYDRITDTIIALSAAIRDTETDESTWWIGEGGAFSLADLIAGAYWHYSEWHGGQSSKGYLALSALGYIYSPGMCDGPEDGSGEWEAYQSLNHMADS